jgi:hypothetical protein
LARPAVRGTFSQPGPSHPAVAVRLARTLGLTVNIRGSPAPLTADFTPLRTTQVRELQPRRGSTPPSSKPEGIIVRNCPLTILTASAILLSFAAHADGSVAKESRSVGSIKSLSKEETQRGVENGIFCTDAKGLANSRGAIITQNGKKYRCVKAYGESFNEHKTLVWVEVLLKDGGAVTTE